MNRNRKPYDPVKNPGGYLPPNSVPRIDGYLLWAFFPGLPDHLTRVNRLGKVGRVEPNERMVGWWPTPQEQKQQA